MEALRQGGRHEAAAQVVVLALQVQRRGRGKEEWDEEGEEGDEEEVVEEDEEEDEVEEGACM